MDLSSTIFDMVYLVCSVLFIVGIKQLSNPKSARNGNLLSALAMFIAILVALIRPMEHEGNYIWIFVSIALGALVGYYKSIKTSMTAMPELVSIFNGFGGACAMLISLVQLVNISRGEATIILSGLIVILLTLFIGCLSFTGSMVAYGKLSGKIKSSFSLPYVSIINVFFLILVAIMMVLILNQSRIDFNAWILPFTALALIYGITFVISIGGADMPVIISLLNSLTGITSLLAGLIYNDQLMILGGILVGSSGSLLTILMCKAMNRSLFNVIVGGIGGKNIASASSHERNIQTTTLTDTAIILNFSEKVAIIPGYGMAVAKAQQSCKEIEKLLSEKNIEINFCIHPVAGRMPGHMNVLLAEADVPYELLKDLEASNQYLKNVDIAIVVGANDVVNPAAVENPDSPIHGMPILDLSHAKKVVIIKRTMAKGYAGIENELFYKPNASMLFGDGKVILKKLADEIINL